MGRPRRDKLPKHLYRHPLNHAYYYQNPDMTRAYQKGHARNVLRVDMLLPFSVSDDDGRAREEPAQYRRAA